MKKIKSLRTKLLLSIMPCIILVCATIFVATLLNTKKILDKNASEQITLLSSSTNNEMTASVNRVVGILENVKVSIQNSCTTTEEIQTYLFSVADAYTDIIPAGIYCGLTDGTYLDKLWTPDADWVMEERPWYQEGLTKEEVSFGEMYLDANTGDYIISAYTNLKNKKGEVIGVLCADIMMDELNQILHDSKIFDDGYIYAIDKTSGMVFGNSQNKDQNGLLIQDLTDKQDTYIQKLISEKNMTPLNYIIKSTFT